MPKHFDFIIVGQGIAGTMLSYNLIEAGRSILVIDNYNPGSASQVAAGIIHPVTGRRLVKSWMYDVAFPVALQTYRRLEQKFATDFFIEKPILEIFDSIKNKNDWSIKSEDASFTNIAGNILPQGFDEIIGSPHGAIEINGGGFLLIKKLMDTWRNFLLQQRILLNEKFEFDCLIHNESKITYKDYTASKIIFCEGFSANENPFFKTLPFQPAKGEVLIVKCEALTNDYIINKSNYILPLGNQLFKIGATFDWNNLSTETTVAAREKLSQQFAAIVKTPFTIEAHFAAVRPTVKDRKPFAGLHPLYNNIGIFNGLGTKGVLLAPWLAAMMCDYLLHNIPLINEVQFGKYY